MITISIKELEKRLERKIEIDSLVFGIDTASRTGWCQIKTDKENAYIDYGFVDIQSKDHYYKYDKMIEFFESLIKKSFLGPPTGGKVVIEDVFFGRNVNTLKMLARIGMIVYVVTKQIDVPKTFILASTARAKLGFHGTAKKEFVHKQIAKRLKLKITDVDIVDALVLALTGLVSEKGLFNGKK